VEDVEVALPNLIVRRIHILGVLLYQLLFFLARVAVVLRGLAVQREDTHAAVLALLHAIFAVFKEVALLHS